MARVISFVPVPFPAGETPMSDRTRIRKLTRACALGALAAALCLFAAHNPISQAQPAAKPRAEADVPLPPELNLIPRDAAAFVSIRVADLWSSDAAKELRDYLTREPKALDEMAKATGLKISDVERVTLFFPTLPGPDGRREPAPLTVVTTVKPYDPTRMLRAMRAIAPGDLHRGDFDAAPPVTPPPPKPPPAKNEPNLPLPPPSEAPPLGEFLKKAPSAPKQNLFSAVQIEEVRPERNAQAANLTAPFYYLDGSGDTILYLINDRTLLICPELKRTNGESLLALVGQLVRRQGQGPLSAALAAAAGKHALVAGLNVPALKRMLPEELPLALQPFRALLTANSAAAVADLGEELQVNVRLEFANPADAKRGEQTLQAVLTLAREMLPGVRKEIERDKEAGGLRPLLDQLEATLKDAVAEQKNTSVQVALKLKAEAAWATAIKAAISRVQRAGRRTEAANSLKQIGLAAHNYHDALGRFPFPFPGKNGGPAGPNDKALLSWRVAILPFIEQDNLYRQFKFDEPWDSEHNKKLIPLMPKIYASPGVEVEKGVTFYQCFTGPNAMHPGISIANIVDGTSNTLMVVEGGEPVIWTKPDDLPYDPRKPLPKLGGVFDDGFNALFCDGSVRFIKKTVKEEVLRALITANGGEVINLQD
jgi:prepilin-type processing-associated H-X9-DG protein